MNTSAVTRVRAALATQPRIALATLPTPITEATRLREALGGAARLPANPDQARRSDLARPRRQQGAQA